MLWQLALVLLAATHGVCSGLVDTATIPKPDGDTQADPKPVAAAEGMPDKPLTQELKSTYSWSQFSAPSKDAGCSDTYPWTTDTSVYCYAAICGAYLTSTAGNVIITDGACACMTKFVSERFRKRKRAFLALV